MKKWILSLLLLATAWHGALQGAYDHSFDDKASQEWLKPYLLPKRHPMKQALDFIFAQNKPLANEEAFMRAGFRVLLSKRSSSTRNAYFHLGQHPLVPGYLFKVYLDSEEGLKKNEGWNKLANRCRGAENIRKLIKEKGLRHFVVPDKWLYRVPDSEQEAVLMVTDMELVSRAECKKAWKSATKEQLDELYCILSHGLSSTWLLNNIPYTRKGKFACIDTEHPKRRPRKMKQVRHYLSKEMQHYWDHLIEFGGKI
jgi:hypothetical protein